MRWHLPAILLLSGLVPRFAAADEAQAIRLEYEAAADCPDRAALVDAVLRRSPGVRLAANGETAPEFRVVVAREDGVSSARLTVRDGTAAPVVRELGAPECAELVASMAVVIALAIDARTASEPLPPREVEPIAPPPDPPRPPPVTAPAERGVAGNSPEPALPVRGSGWVLGAGASVVSDAAPTWSPGAFVFSDLGLVADLRGRVSLGYATSGELERAGATLRFSRLLTRGELCPALVQPSTALSLRPCGGIELGSHHAEGEFSTRLEQPKSSSDLWFAGVLALRAELAVTRFLVVELEAQGRFPFLHRTYVFERPDEVAYETPRVGAGLQLGVGWPVIR